MSDTIRRVDYYYATVPHRAGQGAAILNAFKDANVNFLALHAFPEEGAAQLDFFPQDSAAFEVAAKEAGIEVSPRKTAFLVQGRDRVGAIAGILGRLGDAGVNVTALDAVTADGGFGALLWVDSEKVETAAKALGAASG